MVIPDWWPVLVVVSGIIFLCWAVERSSHNIVKDVVKQKRQRLLDYAADHRKCLVCRGNSFGIGYRGDLNGVLELHCLKCGHHQTDPFLVSEAFE